MKPASKVDPAAPQAAATRNIDPTEEIMPNLNGKGVDRLSTPASMQASATNTAAHGEGRSWLPSMSDVVTDLIGAGDNIMQSIQKMLNPPSPGVSTSLSAQTRDTQRREDETTFKDISPRTVSTTVPTQAGPNGETFYHGRRSLDSVGNEGLTTVESSSLNNFEWTAPPECSFTDRTPPPEWLPASTPLDFEPGHGLQATDSVESAEGAAGSIKAHPYELIASLHPFKSEEPTSIKKTRVSSASQTSDTHMSEISLAVPSTHVSMQQLSRTERDMFNKYLRFEEYMMPQNESTLTHTAGLASSNWLTNGLASGPSKAFKLASAWKKGPQLHGLAPACRLPKALKLASACHGKMPLATGVGKRSDVLAVGSTSDMDLNNGNEVQPMAGLKSKASHYGVESIGLVGNSNSGTPHYGAGPSEVVETHANVQHQADPNGETPYHGRRSLDSVGGLPTMAKRPIPSPAPSTMKSKLLGGTPIGAQSKRPASKPTSVPATEPLQDGRSYLAGDISHCTKCDKCGTNKDGSPRHVRHHADNCKGQFARADKNTCHPARQAAIAILKNRLPRPDVHRSVIKDTGQTT